MPEMYVANVSKQDFNFIYRVPERKGPVSQMIRAGSQVKLAPWGTAKTNLSQPDIDAVIAQFAKYGMKEAGSIDLNRGPFTGLCYTIGKPVATSKMLAALEKNEDTLFQQGVEMRKEAAIATSDSIEEGMGVPLRGLEMSVSEIEPRGGFHDDGMKHVAEGVRVTRGEMTPMTEAAGSTTALPTINVTAPRRARRG